MKEGMSLPLAPGRLSIWSGLPRTTNFFGGSTDVLLVTANTLPESPSSSGLSITTDSMSRPEKPEVDLDSQAGRLRDSG